MRTFHIGGVHREDDITRGLARVIELFEARRPGKDRPGQPAVLAEFGGVVRLGLGGKSTVYVAPVTLQGERATHEGCHLVPPGRTVVVKDGQRVEVGQPLTDGRPLAQDLLRLCGVRAAQDYLVTEVLGVYRAQGVPLEDKHVEVIVARMFRKVKVVSPGDTDLLPGSVVDREVLRRANEGVAGLVRVRRPGASAWREGELVRRDACEAEKKRLDAAGRAVPLTRPARPAEVEVLLMGVSRAAVQSQSFLSAASFQETTRVLTDAALAGKVDPLAGLKENVLAGRLVPAGTGFRPEGA